MPLTTYNERSWAIDLISDINVWLSGRNITISRAGGEHTLRTDGGSLFPDLLLFGDSNSGSVLQGWELKMPDTAINDPELLDNAKKKAKALGLESFLVWNVTSAALYKIKNDELTVLKAWNDLSYINSRELVLPNMDAVRSLLGTILEDLNTFFQNGTILPASIIDTVTGDGLTDMVLSNIERYSEELGIYANANYQFEDEVNLWWLASKRDFPDEPNRWKVLARNNLITLFNKFVFAHALRHYSASANVVDSINEKTTIKTGLEIFETISKSADFWNIFSKNLGEDLIGISTWSNFLTLNAVLRDFNISSVEISLVHELLDKLSLRGKRKIAGQFATPYELAKLISALVILNPEKNVLDPCCGTGTIAKAVLDLKKLKGVSEPLDTTWASDKFALPLKMATLAVSQPESMGKVLNIFKADATQIRPGQQITLHDPYDGSDIVKELPSFPYIVSNLPFVQQEDVGNLNPDIYQINDWIASTLNSEEFGLGRRSDLYAYLPFFLWRMLEDDGKLGIIISNSWLATEMGASFFKLLKRFFYIEAIVTSGKGRWFLDAKVVTNILILRKNDQPEKVVPQQIKFAVLKKSIYDTESDYDFMSNVRALLHSTTATDDNTLRVQSYNNADLDYLNTISLPYSSFFADLSWIKEIMPSSVKVSTLFNVNRGERRGWDQLFFPSAANSIEDDYLKPVLKTPQSIHSLIAEADGLAFCCSMSEDELERRGDEGALSWIRSFKHLVNGTNVPLPDALARSGVFWYTMKPDTMADIVTAINFGERLFFGKFDEPTFVNQRLIRFTRTSPSVDVDLSHALLNSIFGLFYIEALGFGRGEGALDLSATRLKNCMMMLDPDKITSADRDMILEKFKPLLNRQIKSLPEELASQDRQEFDAAVLRMYGLEHLHDKVRDSLITLYEIRNTVNDTN